LGLEFDRSRKTANVGVSTASAFPARFFLKVIAGTIKYGRAYFHCRPIAQTSVEAGQLEMAGTGPLAILNDEYRNSVWKEAFA
jgi:hypothetical protein